MESLSTTKHKEHKKKKERKHKHSKNKKRKHSTSELNSSDEEDRKHHKKHKKQKSSSSNNSFSDHEKKILKKCKKKKHAKTDKDEETSVNVDIPVNLMTKPMAPMTKEQWEKQQSITKRVFDETTGRYRLIKGDGEVIEEIVSRDRHKLINQAATKGDGQFFQNTLLRR